VLLIAASILAARKLAQVFDKFNALSGIQRTVRHRSIKTAQG
jgi:hypothetical protein